MGCFVKNEGYTNLQKDVVKYAKTFSHPARVTIMELLVNIFNCICNDLVESLLLAQSTVQLSSKKINVYLDLSISTLCSYPKTF